MNHFKDQILNKQKDQYQLWEYHFLRPAFVGTRNFLQHCQDAPEGLHHRSGTTETSKVSKEDNVCAPTGQ